MESTGIGHTEQEQIQRSLTFRAASMRTREPKMVLKARAGLSGNEFSDPAEIPPSCCLYISPARLPFQLFLIGIFLVSKRGFGGATKSG